MSLKLIAIFFALSARRQTENFADEKGQFTDKNRLLTKKREIRCNLCNQFYILQTKQTTGNARLLPQTLITHLTTMNK